MTGRFSRMRDRLVNATLGVELRSILVRYQESLESLQRREAEIDLIYRRVLAQLEPIRQERDGTAKARASLDLLRKTREYSMVFDVAEPLVSVRIASYQNLDALMGIAVPSVLAQTYQNFEVIVVNDGPSDETKRAIEGLKDPRFRYDEFAERNVYPANPTLRWMVAGSPAMNRGASLAKGTWIAPLDQDDSFTADHLEKLIVAVEAERAELAYGAVALKNLVSGEEAHVWSSPPAQGHFSFQGTIYLRLLRDVFRYDEQSWLVGEPGDWNMVRRMSDAGVKMTAIRDVVAIINNTPVEYKDA